MGRKYFKETKKQPNNKRGIKKQKREVLCFSFLIKTHIIAITGTRGRNNLFQFLKRPSYTVGIRLTFLFS
jgi:hypothetical protein